MSTLTGGNQKKSVMDNVKIKSIGAEGGGSHGVVTNVLDWDIVVRTPVALLRSFSG